eukprot:GFUD01020487.1.p1 GENE.GFUD01020487.1~~GFUD01020487.1.p1  ORF type:complete len:209 (+),score=51.96 GFUD01020487.1:174-800(+)
MNSGAKCEDCGCSKPNSAANVTLEEQVEKPEECKELQKVSKVVAIVEQDDSLTIVVKKQEAALKRLEEKHGSGYGKPPPGSKSEARAKKYNENCTREIVELCGIVSEKGFTDTEDRRAILFQDLFNTYRFISDKCCGLLLRARRYKLISFQGEMLFQGKDDKTVITMMRTFVEIHGHYKETKQLIGPDEVYLAPKPSIKAPKPSIKKE